MYLYFSDIQSKKHCQDYSKPDKYDYLLGGYTYIVLIIVEITLFLVLPHCVEKN